MVTSPGGASWGLAAYLAFLLAVAAERIFELVLSRKNASRLLARGGVELGQTHYRVMKQVHTLFLISCAVEATLLPRHFPEVVGAMALLGALGAQALRYWAIRTLGERWSTRVIVLPGVEPVTTGPYRFIKHPNYLAVIAEMVCIPLVYGAWMTAVVFSAANALLLAVRIRTEEQALGATWSQAFEGARRFVPGGRRV
jgi:methyltransferase